MTNHTSGSADLNNRKLIFWVKNSFYHPKEQVVPLLMHMKELGDRPEHAFYQPLKDWLSCHVEVRFFDEPEEAGKLVVLPHPVTRYIGWKHIQEVQAFHQQLIALGKTPVIFEEGWEYRNAPGELLFANAVYRDGTQADNIVTPLWGYDNGHLSYDLEKPAQPTVNFMGATEYNSRYNRLLFRHFLFPKSLTNYLATKSWFRNRSRFYDILFWRKVIARQVRKRVVGEMRRMQGMQVSVVERNATFFELSKEEQTRIRQEYLEAMADHAYTVISRGDGNCAYTFFEILSFGRIPVWIDTNGTLPPLGDGLRYEDFAIIVPFDELHTLQDRIQAFHDQHNPAQFAQACTLARKAYEYLLPHQFLPRLFASWAQDPAYADAFEPVEMVES